MPTSMCAQHHSFLCFFTSNLMNKNNGEITLLIKDIIIEYNVNFLEIERILFLTLYLDYIFPVEFTRALSTALYWSPQN